MMKNVIAFILFLAIGVSQINLSIVSHFCSGQKVDTVVSWSEAHHFCSMDQKSSDTPSTKDQFKPQRCCINKITSIATDKSIASEKTATTVPLMLFLLPLLLNVLLGLFVSKNTVTPLWSESIPTLTINRQILFQSFLH